MGARRGGCAQLKAEGGGKDAGGSRGRAGRSSWVIQRECHSRRSAGNKIPPSSWKFWGWPQEPRGARRGEQIANAGRVRAVGKILADREFCPLPSKFQEFNEMQKEFSGIWNSLPTL